jgi:23S rRNA (uracil1939-C5)-methyltransferase
VGRSRKKKPLLENLEIIDVAAEGKALGKVDDRVVFVTKVIPGDIVDVQVTRKRKNFYEGYPVKFHKYSEKRIEPFCEHFGVCGGCKWQPLPYEEQVKFKEREVLNNLKRLGGIDLPEHRPILASKQDRFYRNKLEFTFSDNRWLTEEELNSGEEITDRNGLGFHIPGMFDKVVDVRNCYLQPEPSNSIRLAIKEYALKNGLTFFNLRNKGGFLRNLIIRTSPTTGEVMVILSFYHEDEKERIALLDHLKNKFPEITSLMYVINPKANDTISDLEVKLFSGKDHIIETMEDLRFKVGPKSFYQTNSLQAYELYKVAREFAGLNGDEIVYDLYTGTGTIANFVAKNAKKVVGIEYIPEAIEDAKENSKFNNITNTSFYAGDMKDVLTSDFIEKEGKPDVIITDPPRAGMHADVVKAILDSEPERIVYVSCNSATQARDLTLLDEKYKVTEIQPVDMFPQTHHVENIVLLKRKS